MAETNHLETRVTNLLPEQGSQESAVPQTGSGPGDPIAPAGALESGGPPVPEIATAAAAPRISEQMIVQLRPIGEASYGPLGPVLESVIDTDERRRITTTDRYPWRVHASLRITAADGSAWIGTGWFISPRTLITAGHVVHIKHSPVPGRNGWVRRIEVIPGRNEVHRPFGSAISTEFHSVTGWTENGDAEYDYGAIVLPETQPLGNQTGWIGYAAYTDAELLSAHLNIAGYPGDKPDGTQWYDHRMTDSVTERKVFYQADTAGGQSGSAVYRIVGDNRFSVGIHAYGVGGGFTSNSATRINSRRFDNLTAWSA
jgi:V8-like Glu-specific endopeptidase